MSRPKPTLLLEYIDKKTFKVDQILLADSIWAVFYQDMPINLKSDANSNDPKYKKVSFSNPAHAINLAEKLNKMFHTNEFSVYKLTKGEKVF
jgi:hypothetical protein